MADFGALYGAGNGKNGGAGSNGVAAVRILSVGGGRNGNLSGKRGECTGGCIVGVVYTRSPCSTVIRYGDGVKNGSKGVGNNNVIGGQGCSVAGVFYDEGVSELPVLGYSSRVERFAEVLRLESN